MADRDTLSNRAMQERSMLGDYESKHHHHGGVGWMVLWFFLMWFIVFIVVLLILYAIRPTVMQGTYYGQGSCDGIGRAALTALALSLIVIIIVALIWWSISGWY